MPDTAKNFARIGAPNTAAIVAFRSAKRRLFAERTTALIEVAVLNGDGRLWLSCYAAATLKCPVVNRFRVTMTERGRTRLNGPAIPEPL